MSRHLARQQVMRQPRIQSASPLSVIINLLLISDVARSDSALESETKRMLSTLVADMDKDDELCHIYTLQSVSQ